MEQNKIALQTTDFAGIMKEIHAEIQSYSKIGKLPTYIPELKKINPNKFGVHLLTVKGDGYSLGDADEKFSIQSISKVFSLALAFSIFGDTIWKRIGVEPAGTRFNSLVQLEFENGIPRNPLINSGSIVISDMLVSKLKNPKKEFLDFLNMLADSADVTFNLQVAQSERATGFRNAALANLLKSFKNLKQDVEEVLDFYFHQCAVEMSCRELARSFAIFAHDGRKYETVLSTSQIKRLNAIMQTCGFYDEAGDFTFKVGLPGKSGVGGGIAAVYPQHYSIATWSPKLNVKGNSVMGMKFLELFTTKTGMSIF
jgi:glutaminase